MKQIACATCNQRLSHSVLWRPTGGSIDFIGFCKDESLKPEVATYRVVAINTTINTQTDLTVLHFCSEACFTSREAKEIILKLFLDTGLLSLQFTMFTNDDFKDLQAAQHIGNNWWLSHSRPVEILKDTSILGVVGISSDAFKKTLMKYKVKLTTFRAKLKTTDPLLQDLLN